MLPLLLACASPNPASRYSEAMAAADYDRAFALCDGIGSFEADCQTAVIDRFKRYEDCHLVSEPGECEFRHAEQLGVDDPVAGIAACQGATPYVPDCDEHLLGMLSNHASTLAEAESLYALAEPALQMPGGRGHFLRIWFRGQLNAHLPVDVSGCADAVCVSAARHEIATFEGSRTPNAPPPPGIGPKDAP